MSRTIQSTSNFDALTKHNKYSSTRDISYLIGIIYLISLFSTPVSNMISDLKGKVILLLLWLVVEIAINGFSRIINLLYYRNKEFFFLVMWIFTLLLYRLYEIGDMATWKTNYFDNALFFLSSFVVSAVCIRHRAHYLKFIIVALFIIAMPAALSLRTLYQLPDIVRNIRYYPWLVQDNFLLFIGSITYYSAISITMPIFITAYFYFEKNYVKYSIGFLVLVILATILMTTLIASTIVALFGFLCTYLYNIKVGKSTFKLKHAFMILILFTIIMLVFSVVEQGVYSLTKIDKIYQNIVNQNLSDIKRLNDSVKSMESFVNNPFLGVGLKTRGMWNEIGEHSTWIDSLAEFGLIGFSPFILFIFFAWRRVRAELKHDSKDTWNYARLIGFYSYLIMGLLNPFGYDAMCSVLLNSMVLVNTIKK